MLEGKKVLLAVCGSIAAYKAAFFVRLLIKAKAEVRVVMTSSAKDFITPLTLSTLSKGPVYSDFFDSKTGEWESHVELGLWADVMIIAPASANSIGKLANGLCDNLLSATYLSARCPVFVSPAMDLDKYQHPATTKNLDTLKKNGNTIIHTNYGELASGLEGEGRMAEPEELIEVLDAHFKKKDDLSQKTILITSGPTYEAIDPVRYIGNHSSGKMGKSIAEECALRGAKVKFVTGPVRDLPIHPSIDVQPVNSANEMLDFARQAYENADIAIFAAAVSDYRPKHPLDQKHKRNGGALDIELIENPDSASELGKRKGKHQINVGFALETNNAEEQAQKKLKSKNFDLIVLNTLEDHGAGFSHSTNKVTILDEQNKRYPFELKEKTEVASDIIDVVMDKLHAQ